jgi:hypothetical protein
MSAHVECPECGQRSAHFDPGTQKVIEDQCGCKYIVRCSCGFARTLAVDPSSVSVDAAAALGLVASVHAHDKAVLTVEERVWRKSTKGNPTGAVV